ALRRSRIREVVVLGRRGPAQASFTTPELRELGRLQGVDAIVDPRDLELDAVSRAEMAEDRTATANLRLLHEYAARTRHPGARGILLRFLTSPVEIIGTGGQNTPVKVGGNERIL